MENRALTNLRKRLEGFELEHLRQLAVELREQLEQAEAAAEQSAENAAFWQRHAMDLQEALHDGEFATHRSIGITKAGELLVVKHDA